MGLRASPNKDRVLLDIPALELYDVPGTSCRDPGSRDVGKRILLSFKFQYELRP